MNKLIIGAFALAAATTGAFAAANDHGGNGQDNPAYFYNSTETKAFTIEPGVTKKGEIPNYLNERQLR